MSVRRVALADAGYCPLHFSPARITGLFLASSYVENHHRHAGKPPSLQQSAAVGLLFFKKHWWDQVMFTYLPGKFWRVVNRLEGLCELVWSPL